jgi:hypothetical protein
MVDLLKTHPGQDQFDLYIPVNGQAVQISYDLRIGYDSQLAADLKSLGVVIQKVR